MNRMTFCISIALAAGVGAVSLFPLEWLGPLAEVAAISTAILLLIVRIETKTKPPSNEAAGLVLQLLNLPEQPCAEVKKTWALTGLLTSSTFLVSLCLSLMVKVSM